MEASLVTKHRLYSLGSIVVTAGLAVALACGTLLHQETNSCPLYWRVDSSPLSHWGSPQQIIAMSKSEYVQGWKYSITSKAPLSI